MHWSYASLMMCPREHLDAIIQLINEEANANGD
jgi:hypothetical protein